MSRQIAVREQKPFELTEKQLNIIANTEFVPKDKRGKMDVILASVFRGRALGIDDMTAIQEIHIVNGRPGESAALAAGLVRRRGHLIDGKVSPSGAVAHGRRSDNGAELTVEFGPEQAKAAGLEGNVNYKKYPQSMYWARAVTQLCRSLFSDCFLGGVYTPDELGADYIVEEDVIDYDQTAGGLPEPEVSGDRPVPQPTDEPPSSPLGGSASGSVNSWADLKARREQLGLSEEELREKARDRFAPRNASEVQASEWNELWLELAQAVLPV